LHLASEVLYDDFQRPSSSPQQRQWDASIPPPQRRIDQRQSANAVGDDMLAAREWQLLDVDHPRVDEFDVAH